MKRWWAVIILAVGGLWWPAEATAEASEPTLNVGLSAGAGWQWMIEPTDQEGEPTVLYGSAFGGMGVMGGPSIQWGAGVVDGVDLSVEIEGLYGYHRGTGFAEHSEGRRIEATLSTHVFRFPVQLVARGWAGDLPVYLGAGVEPILGVHSASSVDTENVDVPIAPLETRPIRTVAGVASAGLEFSHGDREFPVGMRVSFDPGVPESSRGRLEGYESDEEPGEFGVQFDVYLMMVAGMRF